MKKQLVLAIIFAAAGVLYAANELTTSFGMTFNKSGVTTSVTEQDSITVTGTSVMDQVANLNTNDNQITLLNITPGYVFIKNLDTNNYIEVGASVSNYTIKCGTGESALFRLTGTNLHIRSNGTNCSVRIKIIEN